MTKITICYYDFSRDDEYASSCHIYTHVAAVIEDEQNEEKPIIVNFSAKGSNPPVVTVESAFNLRDVDKVILYSNKSMAAFHEMYQKKFMAGSYGMYNNCADAVNAVLDYFFPDAHLAQCWYNTVKILCCLPAILCCGYFCVPPPLGISAPMSVFDKALSISNKQQKKAHLEEKKVFYDSSLAMFGHSQKEHTVLTRKQNPLKSSGSPDTFARA